MTASGTHKHTCMTSTLERSDRSDSPPFTLAFQVLQFALATEAVGPAEKVSIRQ